LSSRDAIYRVSCRAIAEVCKKRIVAYLCLKIELCKLQLNY
jgi:hypothetical protein